MFWRWLRGVFTGRNYSDDELRLAVGRLNEPIAPVILDRPLREADRERLVWLNIERQKEALAVRELGMRRLELEMRAMG